MCRQPYTYKITEHATLDTFYLHFIYANSPHSLRHSAVHFVLEQLKRSSVETFEVISYVLVQILSQDFQVQSTHTEKVID